MRFVVFSLSIATLVIASCQLLDLNPGPAGNTTLPTEPHLIANMVVDTAIGHHLYAQLCARCHGDSGQGTTQMPRNIQGQSGIATIVRIGQGLMTAFPTLSDSDIKSIELYLAQFRSKSIDTMSGPTLFAQFCATCHADSGQGIVGKGVNIQNYKGVDSIVRHSKGTMPTFPWMTTAQTKSIEDFLAVFVVVIPTDGPGLFRFYCASCHGDSAQGITGHGTNIQRRTGVFDVVHNGKGRMTPIPAVTVSQAQLIESFLATFQAPLPTDGASLYKYFCASCHGDSALGITGQGSNIQRHKNVWDVVHNGKGKMLPLSLVTQTQAQSIEDWLGTLNPPLPPDGPGLYRYYCVSCHGDSALGLPGLGSNIQRYAGVYNIVHNGKGRMTAIPAVTPTQAQLIEYYLATFTIKLPTDGPGLYKYYCSTCHGDSALGITGSGPNIQRRTGIYTTVHNGKGKMSALPAVTQAQTTLIESFLATFAAPLPTDGAGLFKYYCASCHGDSALGITGSGSNIQRRTGIYTVIHNGKGKMLAIPAVTQSQATLIEGFLATFQAPLPTDGPGLYKYYCSSCHGDSALGITGSGSNIQRRTGIYTVIHNGKGKMLAIPAVTQSQAALIEGFLATFLAPLPTDGGGLFKYYCASCHGDSALGITGSGPNIQRRTGIYPTVHNGKGKMLAIPTVTQSQATLIESWLGAFPAPLPTDSAGLYVYYCRSCHGDSAQGISGLGTNIQRRTGVYSVVHFGQGRMSPIPAVTQAQAQTIEKFLATFLPVIPTTGSGLFKYYCATCHGDSALGITGSGTNIQRKTGIYTVVHNGKGRMTAIPAVTQSQATLIENFLATFPAVIPSDGAGLFKYYCASCHGDSAQGIAGQGPGIQRHTGIYTIIQNGKGRMVPIPAVTQTQAQAIETWLGTLSLPTDGPGLYNYFCASCHGASGQGVAGSGVGIQQYNGISTIVRDGTRIMPAMPQVTTTQASLIQDYVNTFALPTTGDGMYTRWCARCHGMDAMGDTNYTPGLVGSKLGGTKLWAAVSTGSANGPKSSHAMASIPQVSQAQADLIDQYLVGMPSGHDGKTIYITNCYWCHGATGGEARGHSKSDITEAVQKGKKEGSRNMYPYPRMTTSEIDSLYTYLKSL